MCSVCSEQDEGGSDVWTSCRSGSLRCVQVQLGQTRCFSTRTTTRSDVTRTEPMTSPPPSDKLGLILSELVFTETELKFARSKVFIYWSQNCRKCKWTSCLHLQTFALCVCSLVCKWFTPTTGFGMDPVNSLSRWMWHDCNIILCLTTQTEIVPLEFSFNTNKMTTLNREEEGFMIKWRSRMKFVPSFWCFFIL